MNEVAYKLPYGRTLEEHRAYIREYIKRPDQKEKRKIYRESHKLEHKLYYRDYRARHPNRSLYRAAHQRATKSGMDFNIDFDDIVIPKICPVLGIPIVIYAGSGRPGGYMNSPSIDRIDNTKGYIKGNIQVISHKANAMKFNANSEELKAFADWINKTYV